MMLIAIMCLWFGRQYLLPMVSRSQTDELLIALLVGVKVGTQRVMLVTRHMS